MKILHNAFVTLIAAAIVAVLMFAVSECADARVTKNSTHYKTCRDARMEFFGQCERLVAQRPECEVMWSQLRGHVFDAEPDKPWAQEIDCSTEVK